MTRYPRTGTQPETLVKILITVIEKTPSGGATMEELQEAYAEINDQPSVHHLPPDQAVKPLLILLRRNRAGEKT